MKGIILFSQNVFLILFYMDKFGLADVLDNKASFVAGNLNKNDLLDIVRRIEHLELNDNNIKNENRRLRREVTSLKTHISFLTAETDKAVSDLQSQITNLQTKNQQNEMFIQTLLSTLEIDISDQKTSLSKETNDMELETKYLLDDIAPEINETSVQKERTDDLEKKDQINREIPDANQIPKRYLGADEQRIVRRENEVIVAFYATVGQHHIEHAGANQAIVFDDVITNLGTAYSKYAGDFRAPVSGTYVFSVTLMAYGGHTTHYRIVKNGTGMGNIYLRGQDGAYTSSALTTVLELKQGDNVSVQNIDPDEYLFGYAYSAFSGFLLQQDFSNQAIVGK